tara:strand:+ start:372 stop:791 length:420 start_codon:yes stop_codon:yes gene_type:complete
LKIFHYYFNIISISLLTNIKNALKYKKRYYLTIMNSDENNNDIQRGLLLDSKPKTKKPSMYNVLLMNDDYTPMEFVVMVLEKVFNKKSEEATQIMMHVHKNGIGICGIFTYEVAESKCKSVMDLAKKNEHPLQCTMEKS